MSCPSSALASSFSPKALCDDKDATTTFLSRKLSISKNDISRLSLSTHLDDAADPRFCIRASEEKQSPLDRLRD